MIATMVPRPTITEHVPAKASCVAFLLGLKMVTCPSRLGVLDHEGMTRRAQAKD